MNGFVVLETGEVFEGKWWGGEPQAGEVVFNTSSCGYEEIATDPSYFSQIMVMTNSMQGNYGTDDNFWESDAIHIKGFVCLEVQHSERESSWVDQLTEKGVPVISDIDTRKLVLRLRDKGTSWGAIVKASSRLEALDLAGQMIRKKKKQFQESLGWDWPYLVSTKNIYEVAGENVLGPKVAVLDFGVKKNIIRELKKRCSVVGVFPSRVDFKEIEEWKPDGILLSNGPGDPGLVEHVAHTVAKMVSWKPIMGICMGHQILSIALGAKTFKLTFGHRGGNHPVKDEILGRIYMTSQNHGYAVDAESLPKGVVVSHVNLNDNTVSGISYLEKKCFSVQFHPESHPGPREAEGLFDYFVGMLL